MQADQFVWSMVRADDPDSPARSRTLARLAEKLPGRSLEERYILGLRAWDAVKRGEARRTTLTYAEKALRGGMSWTDETRGFEVPLSVALVYMHGDQPRRAEELFGTGIAECVAKGWHGSHLAFGQTIAGYIRYRRGCLAEAEDLVREGLRIAGKVEGVVAAQLFGVSILIQILLARGRVTEARALADEHHFGEMTPNAVIYPDPRTVYAELLLAEGRHAEAAELLSAVGDWLDGRAWRNPAWCPWQFHLASALARAQIGHGAALSRNGRLQEAAQADALTAPERRTAELTVQGSSVEEIAKELRLTPQGVRQLLSSVYRKMGTGAAGLAKALEGLPRHRH
ncbi:helix-turn-helix transcriptional regulator [Streptomyces puniciscabiei]